MDADRLPRILVVDDEPNICKSCVKILTKTSCIVKYALNGHDALKMVDEEPFDVILTDLRMSRLGGMEVLARIKEIHPDTVIIVITGYASVSSAVEVMKMGAFDYLPKPFTPQELRSVVKLALFERELRIQNRLLRNEKKLEKPISHQLVGKSHKIRKVIHMVGKVAPTESTVLITGESGTGKELIARAVHANSNRNNEVFFAIDCGTLTGNLLESELFGYHKGAFTGAHKDKEGIFKLAHKGTVFLDEISNISTQVQGKLLRFLETREFIPLGASNVESVDVRLIFATNKNLELMVGDGTFREDFYYRIFVYPILLPPLRERKEDILPIAYHFLEQFCINMNKPINGFSHDAVNRLNSYDWPGNVRQLKNVVERAVILCEKNLILRQDLPLHGEVNNVDHHSVYIPVDNTELKKMKKEIRQKAVADIEKKFVVNALMNNQWNITAAAKDVNMQRSNFQNLLKKYKINKPEIKKD